MVNKGSFAMGLLTGFVAVLVLLIGFQFYSLVGGATGGMRPRDGQLAPMNKIEEIYRIISTNSIMPFDRDEMLENMYRGFVAGVGDPYTQYLCRESFEAFTTRTDGAFVGIGVRVLMDPADRMLTLVSVFADAPAGRAGLMPGDKVVTVDGIDVVGRTQQEIVGMITGIEGTNVNIGIFRPYENEHFEVDIIRERVVVPTVFHEMIETENGRTGYIRIDAFERPTYQQFYDALQELILDDMESLIIDVRNNPGGLLDVVVDIANLLVPEGNVTFVEDVNGRRRYHPSNSTYLGIPLVILINERSASASEVLGGAVQDFGVGTLVGEQSFGKGSVQNLYRISDGTAVKVTIAKYFTPNGASIHGIGLTPDFVVEMDEDLTRRIGEISHEEDVQLQIALVVVQRK